MDFVDELLNSTKKKGIIAQAKLLREHKDNEYVKIYLEELDKCNLSPYTRWVVDKYLFDRKVSKKPEVKKVTLFGIRGIDYESKNN